MNTSIIRQENIAKLLLNKWFWIVFFIFTFGYPVYRSMNRTLPKPLPVYFKLPSYKLTNEFNKSFGSNDLKGRIYLANFIFTRCPVKCPALMKKMQSIQKRMRGLGASVAIVSFTVDPLHDKPPQLFKYARDLQTNPHIWNFLTGNLDAMENLLVKGFKVPIGDTRTVSDIVDLAHSEKVVLVDREGRVRGYYGTDKISIDQMMIDVGLLANNAFRGET
ncbi:MAG: SCO family protein [Halobacteriovoraceae bacterium]|nr:SCO family protein [Halobacteriovoraceae bacterium]